MKTINVAIVGYGVVGNGVAKILEEKRELIRKKSNVDINLKKVFTRNWNKKFPYEIDKSKRVNSIDDILNDEDIDIIVEVVGGIEFPYKLMMEAINKNKNIVTANKALLAEKGKEIFKEAEKKNIRIGFEAAVAGGIPIIKALREGLIANNINKIYGILNGTTNYILTSMYKEGKDFKTALSEAQKEGYAEADPTLDINGTDAAHKIAILSSLAFGGYVDFSKIYKEGIENIDILDIELGKELGYILKLLAIGKAHGEEVEIRVNPTFLPANHPLSKVDGVFNAVMVEGDSVGETMFYGKGAGSLPTASAVVSDIVDIAKSISLNIGREIEITSLNWQHKDLNLTKVKDFFTRYYVRFTVPDITGILAKVATIFAKYNISIAAVIQKEKVLQKYQKNDEKIVPLVILTHTASENSIQKAIKEIEENNLTREKTVLIRVEDEDR
ncbi:homoserine dehydrogenase [Venenivibrio stagnispumantis]|uniref:Homoserine dehydrogenase n=1 Tax=Venenivibrio stagnispumantis TaxID=407998 RepID=A0AA45WLQ3_9AQUI|nr:homoserine dehydrogenase [Venenivibrio stagnispumantis]MCW4573410.1 homoserine dehydrogenase [Venenivibrio stagnispumantis]SMP12179.1 homoserine dehydrogenase [Venenivibrio stagnispumantis]